MPVTVAESLLSELSAFAEASLGLHYPPARWSDLERGLAGAASELGFDEPDECAQWFISGRAIPDQLEVLAIHLTIGETYFFRDQAVFQLLSTHVLPELIRARRGGDRRLRLWSAACCTGEEAYSLAITVLRLLPDISDWEVSILGTDINPRFLQKAHAGIYRPWSFRNAQTEADTGFFRRHGEDAYAVTSEVRRLVTFAPLNLAEDAYPALANGTNGMDVVLCRNVLMYFSPDQMKRAAGKLSRSLVQGGWLFTSPTEAVRELFDSLTPVQMSGALAFRKQDHAFGRALETLAEPPRAAPPAARKILAQPRAKSTTSPPARSLAGEAHRLANEGRLREALTACESALAADKLVAASHYLRGVILQEQGAADAAAAALRRALFLDQSLVVAHFALGNLLRRQGRHKEASRSFANVLTLLRQLQPDAVLPESDGITAGRLLAIVESSQEIGP